ncbi:MAG TPA: hypothetical protein VF732_09850 [Nitrospira sp.]
MPDCPTCHGVSTYEAFSLEAIRDWGTEELIAKAGIAEQAEAAQSAAPPDSFPASSVESTL